MRCLFDLNLRPLDVTVSIYFWDGAHAGAICKGFFFLSLNFSAMTWKTQKRLQGAVRG